MEGEPGARAPAAGDSVVVSVGFRSDDVTEAMLPAGTCAAPTASPAPCKWFVITLMGMNQCE